MKRIIFIIISLVCVLLVGCGSPKTPCAAEEFIGVNYEEAIEKLEKAGFTNINTTEVQDLKSSDILNDGDVGAVTIDGESGFEKGAKYNKDSEIVIQYHTIKKEQIPISSSEVSKMTLEELSKAFENAGFISVESDEVYDIDPDETDSDEYSEVIVNGLSEFSKGEEAPFDSKVEIIGHRLIKKHNVKIIIDFIPNIIFDKYDVEIIVDNEKKDTIKHGEDKEYELELKTGKHTISFVSAESSSVKTEVELDVTSDMEAAYQISCKSDEIVVENQYIDRDEELAKDQVKVLSSADEFKNGNYDYQKAIDTLKEWGLTNVKSQPVYDIEWGFTDEGSIFTVTIEGSEEFNRGDVVPKDSEVIVTYHLFKDADPGTDSENKIHPPMDSSAAMGMGYSDVEKTFKDAGFTDIKKITEEVDSSSENKIDTVAYVKIYVSKLFFTTDGFYPDDTVEIHYYVLKKETETEKVKETETEKKQETKAETEEPKKEKSVHYSTNNSTTVKNGNSGVYAYKKSGPNYNQYYIIDFDEGCVYSFIDGDGTTYGERCQIESGTLNDILFITFDGEYIGLHFKYAGFPDCLVVEDYNHEKYEYSPTDLSDAQTRLAGKTISDH